LSELEAEPEGDRGARCTVSRNGVDLRVDELGAGDPPLVLVHGFTGSHIDWDPVAPALAAERRVVMFDNRGHGDSTNTGDAASYTFAELVGDLTVVVGETAGGGPVDLLGHSMGGIVAMRYALDHPDAIRSLILMDTGAAPAGRLEDFLAGMVALGRAEGMAAVGEKMASYMVGTPMEAQADRVRRKITSMDVEAMDALGRELGTYASMVGELASLRCPVTVIVGENDTGLRGAADVMAEQIPGAELAVIAGAGHSPQEDDPAAWLAVVEKHLAFG
jgi:pimeloyl-ACP methyl ester carboxylesterase